MSVQEVVKPLADYVPPSNLPNITPNITTKQLPNINYIIKALLYA